MNAILRSLRAFWSSSIGRKLIVAVTGILMVLFLVGHLTGNLLIFVGAEAYNDYAKFLHEMLHGAGVWIARVGLLIALGLHVAATISLTIENRKARPAYANESTVQASKSSRLMAWSGLTVLAFIIFHILQYTARVTDDTLYQLGKGDDVYAMVIAGFQDPLVSIFYLISLTLLCSHLSHGIGSVFQTLGLRTRKTRALIDKGSTAVALLLYVGFISIPIAIWLFGYGDAHLTEALQSLASAE